ncbi:MAG TPA: hypothetical protein VEG68_07155 [Terriglobales bacterium]|nr:hypothetical protein [Terriglobales bacterium]
MNLRIQQTAFISSVYGYNLIMCLDVIVKWTQIISYIVGAVAAFSAMWVYRSNSRRERARWAERLYSRYYEKKNLKSVRDLLDSTPDDPKVVEFVREDSSAWTDYLNFFEFVAYLQDSKQLSKEDVWALLGYYFECLKRHRCSSDYIRDRKRGFDYLRKLLLGE